MKKRIISILAILALLLSLLCVSVASAGAATDDVREGVAFVYVYFDIEGYDSALVWVMGSCFFVGNEGSDAQYLVTNHHVIEYYLDLGQGELVTITGNQLTMSDKLPDKVFTGRAKIRVYFDANDYIEAYPIEWDAKKDLALLKLEKPTNKRKVLPLREPTEDIVGKETVRAVGFPTVSDNDAASPTSKWGMTDMTITTGHISRIMTKSGSGQTNLQVDFEIYHGNSGGALVGEDGAVLGVTTWGHSEASGNIYGLDNEEMNYAVSISDVIPILNRNSVKWISASNSNNLTMILIISGAAVVLIAVVIIILVVSSKKKKEKVQNDAQAAAAAAAAAAAQAAQKAAPVLTPTVRSLAIQHRGAAVPITGGQIMVGRNQMDCALCYAANTPGVSGRHCTVAFDHATGDFILTDLKSTYGTFLQNGQKLSPMVQYRLRSGDRFYVGEVGNMIVVELR